MITAILLLATVAATALLIFAACRAAARGDAALETFAASAASRQTASSPAQLDSPPAGRDQPRALEVVRAALHFLALAASAGLLVGAVFFIVRERAFNALCCCAAYWFLQKRNDAEGWRPGVKVVRWAKHIGLFVSWTTAPMTAEVTYQVGVVSTPKPGCGPLFVFASPQPLFRAVAIGAAAVFSEHAVARCLWRPWNKPLSRLDGLVAFGWGLRYDEGFCSSLIHGTRLAREVVLIEEPLPFQLFKQKCLGFAS